MATKNRSLPSLPPTRLRRILSVMSDAATRLNTALALDGHCALEREIDGGIASVYLADDRGHLRNGTHLSGMSTDHV